MSSNTYVGTSSFAERAATEMLVYKAIMKRVSTETRCGLPGIIKSFNPSTQYASVQLAIAENVRQPDGSKLPTGIDQLDDVLVLFPGGSNYCITFPNIVGCECFVCFADMCVNAWATHGFEQDAGGRSIPQKQQLERRHDLSDGFAILAPRSQPNVIPNFSTTNLEIRSMDGTAKIALTNSGIVLLKGTGLEIDGTGGIIVKPGNTPSNASIAVMINGVQYYVRLSSAP
jgi:hypothetical protein